MNNGAHTKYRLSSSLMQMSFFHLANLFHLTYPNSPEEYTTQDVQPSQAFFALAVLTKQNKFCVQHK